MLMNDSDVLIVGAGPVGLLCALLVSQQGLSITLLDENEMRPLQSRAIGITPPSLDILSKIGLAQQFIQHGVQVIRSAGYDTNHRLGSVDFSNLDTDFPFVLALPQNSTESILEQAVLTNKNIRYMRGFRSVSFNERNGVFSVRGTTSDNQSFTLASRFIIGCDGGKSTIRQCASIPFIGHKYPHTFLMADFKDETGWGNEARVYCTKFGSVESFPMPADFRRFVLRTPTFIREGTTDFLTQEIKRRCGVGVDKSEIRDESGFHVQRYTASVLARNNVYLCGDAAHLMSPIGGQNMNTGFADAELAAWLIGLVSKSQITSSAAETVYHRYRMKAIQAASMRAELIMRAGTCGGAVWNLLRNTCTTVALNSPFKQPLYGMFTMLSIPNKTIASCQRSLNKELGLPDVVLH